MSLDKVPYSDATWVSDEPPSERLFTIGELAEEFDVTFRTLRFYESRGFLSPRRRGTTRLYNQADHDRVGLIRKAKRLGFTLREIGMLLEGHGHCGSLRLSRQQCAEQINLLEQRKSEIETALAELRSEYSGHHQHKLGEFEAV
jgi:DNA-binding transcriptional MerR regulator